MDDLAVVLAGLCLGPRCQRNVWKSSHLSVPGGQMRARRRWTIRLGTCARKALAEEWPVEAGEEERNPDVAGGCAAQGRAAEAAAADG